MAAPPPPLPRRAFADAMIAALAKEGVPGEPVWDELGNTLTYPDGRAFNLEENYLEASAQPAYTLDQLYRAYAHLHVHPPRAPATWEQAKAAVFPWLRTKAFHAHVGSRHQRNAAVELVPHGTLTEHLTVCLGLPTPVSVLPVTTADIERWGVTVPQAFNQANANLSERVDTQWQASPRFPGAFRATWNDVYGNARILFRPIFGAVPLRGDPVIVLPSPRMCVLAGSDDEEGLLSLARLTRSFLAENVGFMIRPMRLRGDEMAHWLPPTTSRAHAALRFLEACQEVGDYTDQARNARRLHEAEERPANIPAPDVYEVPGGLEAGSIVTWREGPPCQLPRADYVVFKTRTETLGAAAWSDVQRVLGTRLVPLDIYPPRWLADRFPEPWELSALDLRPIERRPGSP